MLFSKQQNYINHIVLVLDASYSMHGREKDLIQVVDSQVAYLAQRSKDLDQETRVTIYMFSGRSEIFCLIYDKDVLRMPSIAEFYRTMSQTALIDATMLAISDLKNTPEKYGEHAFLLYVFTDGMENVSAAKPQHLASVIAGLPDHWTVAAFVPNHNGVFEAKRFGFPADNIAIWDATTAKGIVEAGKIVRDTTENFMQNRARGIRGSKSLFKLADVSATDIKRQLTPLPFNNYSLMRVPFDQRIDEFVYDNTGLNLVLGRGYYQLMKTEEIQAQKQIAILYQGHIYTGRNAREMLGLPNETVKVKPDAHKDYTIFVQSTAPNRKLIAGTSLLLLH